MTIVTTDEHDARRPATTRHPARLTVVVCTLNEETTVERVIAGVPFADEVLICDSGSTDRTRTLARAAGARVVEQPWLGYARQKNYAARLAAYDWILSLDADEIVTPRLAAAIRAVLDSDPTPTSGFAVDRRGGFYGALLPNIDRRSARTSYVRLYHRGASAWDERAEIHELVDVPGRVRRLRGVLLHWRPFTMDDFFRVFNRNATLEAATLHRSGHTVTALDVAVRPLLRFLWCYFARGNIGMGGRGVVHAAVKASADLMRYAKAWELQQGPPALDPDPSVLELADRARRRAVLPSIGSGR